MSQSRGSTFYMLHVFVKVVTYIFLEFCQTVTCTLRPGHHVSIPGQHFQAETIGRSPLS